jgi:hypothetical protein
MLIAQQKGASSFVTTLPLQKYGFALSKSEFRDHILMRYQWPLSQLPSRCPCGADFSIDHSQICHLGGFINMRHDELRNIIAREMSHVLKDVQCEPPLHPLSGEHVLPTSANTEQDARVDIRARGFWTSQQNAYFDVRVTYPHAQSYLSKSLSSLLQSIENTKKRHYADRINQVDHGTFTPLVFSSCGGMGVETGIALKRLASLIAEKTGEKYCHIISLLRVRISFALIRASLVCLRGSRKLRSVTFDSQPPPSDVILHETRMDS